MPRTSSEATASQPPRRKRSLRCLRCEGRKFRTPRDLALHILSKHGHAHVPPTAGEDARSVTLNSPLITASDIRELDHLLQAAEQGFHASDRPTQGPPKRLRPAPRPCPASTQHLYGVPQGIPKKAWSWTSSSAGSSSYGTHSRRRELPPPPARLVDSMESSDAAESSVQKPPVEGESTGPSAKDVLVARCRSGSVPLVPIQATTAATMNFANGLF